jgi:hypothetical protein
MTTTTHPAWCAAAPGHDTHYCYSAVVETAMGGMWIEADTDGPHVVVDLTAGPLTAADAARVAAAFQGLADLAGGGGRG